MARRLAGGARDAALRALVRVERDAAYLSAALDAELAAAELDRRDAGLTTELAYGTTRHRLALDHALAAVADRPLPRLEHAVLAALRLGAYQLLVLKGVPARAAVHETVEAIKRTGLTRASGFVNAVLRRLATNATPLPTDPVDRICIGHSHPRWLVERWIARYGHEEAAALCAANNVPPAVCLRANAEQTTRDALVARLEAAGVEARASPLAPLGVRVRGAGPIEQLPGFAEGLFQVQDDAAQLVALAAGVSPDDRVLDVCAAPGGKTGAFAATVGAKGMVVALDIHQRKLGRVGAEMARLGLAERTVAIVADATEAMPFRPGGFDVVVVDAPCTGLGTLRRHPELRYRREAADVARIAALQRSILERAADQVGTHGALLYAVCSPEPEEGHDAVASFLATDGRFEAEALEGGEFSGTVLGGELVTLPHLHGCDAFFAARLRRKGTAGGPSRSIGAA